MHCNAVQYRSDLLAVVVEGPMQDAVVECEHLPRVHLDGQQIRSQYSGCGPIRC